MKSQRKDKSSRLIRFLWRFGELFNKKFSKTPSATGIPLEEKEPFVACSDTSEVRFLWAAKKMNGTPG